jgi:hypothetical protein
MLRSRVFRCAASGVERSPEGTVDLDQGRRRLPALRNVLQSWRTFMRDLSRFQRAQFRPRRPPLARRATAEFDRLTSAAAPHFVMLVIALTAIAVLQRM